MHYVIGDIHSKLEVFTKLLQEIEFNPEKDMIYCLGDYIDFGEDAIKTVKKIMDMQKNGYCVPILGNHELFMMDCAKRHPDLGQIPEEKEYEDETWLSYNGGRQTWDLFCKEPIETRKEIIKWMNSLPYRVDVTVNNQKYVLCHAYPSKIVNENDEDFEFLRDLAVWSRAVRYIIPNDIIVIHGHTITYNYKVKKEPNVYDIDCGAKVIGRRKNAKLAAIRLEDLKIYYAMLEQNTNNKEDKNESKRTC